MWKDPKFRIGDLVRFKINQTSREGLICTADDKPIYSSSYEPEYDIFVESHDKNSGGVLYRHIKESKIQPAA